MEKLYKKNELGFALMWIGIYCVLQSLANPLNELIGIRYAASALFCAVQAIAIFGFIKRNGLMERFRLCRSPLPARRFLYYIPLVILASRNFWNGAAMNFAPAELVCHTLCMLCVGFVEEVIFRGFLFEAMAKDNVKAAIIVSSVTFGLGHLLNLINGSGSELMENLFQVTGAIAIGFMFVIIYYRGGSLLPCIITHAAINISSAFANEVGLTVEKHLYFQLVLFVITLGYAFILTKTLPKEAGKSGTGEAEQ